MHELAGRLKVDAGIIQPGVEGLMAAGMVESHATGDAIVLTPAGQDAIARLAEARRGGLTELLEGWNPEEHPEVIDMVKGLANSLLADDERLVADALPEPAVPTGG